MNDFNQDIFSANGPNTQGDPFAQQGQADPFAQQGQADPFAQQGQADPFAQQMPMQADPFAQQGQMPMQADPFAQQNTMQADPFAQQGVAPDGWGSQGAGLFAPPVPAAQAALDSMGDDEQQGKKKVIPILFGIALALIAGAVIVWSIGTRSGDKDDMPGQVPDEVARPPVQEEPVVQQPVDTPPAQQPAEQLPVQDPIGELPPPTEAPSQDDPVIASPSWQVIADTDGFTLAGTQQLKFTVYGTRLYYNAIGGGMQVKHVAYGSIEGFNGTYEVDIPRTSAHFNAIVPLFEFMVTGDVYVTSDGAVAFIENIRP